VAYAESDPAKPRPPRVEFYRVGLVCERLAHEGLLEIRNPRSVGKRYFRRTV
jgi:hypothetical protein